MMQRRDFLRTLGAGLLTAPWLLRQGLAAEPEDRPNILVILTDDMRYDLMSHAGHPYIQTPHLDRLAREGTSFSQAYVTSPVCGPCRASVFTGRHTPGHQRYENWRFPIHGPYLPTAFREAGYQTALVGKNYEGDVTEIRHRYDRTFVSHGPDWSRYTGDKDDQAARTRFYRDHMYLDQNYYIDGRNEVIEGHQTDILFPEAARFTSSARRPFFLMLAPFAPHYPFNPSPRRLHKYQGKGIPGQPDAPLGWQANYERQCEMVEDVDDGIGHLFQALAEAGKLDNTILIFTSDNGFVFGEHGEFGKRSAWQPSTRVPLLVRYPARFAADNISPALVSLADILPTCADLAGVELPADELRHGRSWAPLTKGQAQIRDHHLMLQYEKAPDEPSGYQPPLIWSALLSTDGWKLVRPKDGQPALYHLAQDPDEQRDLAEQEPERVARLSQEIDTMTKRFGG